jgi:6-phosphogluconolactonase
MTLTYPILNRSRRILWLVTEPEKAQMVARLRMGDAAIPAGRVCQEQAILLTDCVMARTLDQIEREETQPFWNGRRSRTV